ncbi:MAG: AAA family ATPase, partial [Mollicutes bacterium PWAP]|nr:AAA family ATPase [Mollicutes bacterium PWAP]
MLNAKVVIGYIIYENPSNGYKVVQFDIRNSSDISINKIRVSGVMKDIQKNFEYEIEVIPSTNLKYKDSFELASIKLSLDLTKERTIKFFASKIFSGIGKIGAENIVDSIGDNAAKLLEKNILLLEKTKLSNEQKEAIISFYDESNGKGQVYKIFNEASLTVNDADEILKIQSPKIFLKKIETDPYYLIYSVTTNFFKSLDSIARVLDIESNDGRRIRAVIFTYLTRNLDNSGDSLINKEEFQIQILKKYYWIQENEYLYNKNYLIKNKFLFENEYNISTSILNKGEKNIYQTINHLSRIIPRYKKVKIGSLPLDEIQISALEHSLNNSFSIILGGPGTGKTTILNDLLESLKTNTTLLSYTGKAVNAINEKLFMDSNIKATTIHKFLRYSKDTLSFDLEPRDDIDTLIIDEFSMVPTILFSTVLSVLPHLERIILLGDENQIPSITSGNLLRDFIREFPNNIVKLEKNYRQDESSSIIFDAALINDMKRPLFNSKSSILKEYDPFDENEMHRSIIKNFFIDKENTVVLCPVYKGINGINFLNQEIKNKIF